MAYNYDNLDWTVGVDNVPGIYPAVYYMRKSDITTWPTLNANPETASETAKYAGNFALEAAKTWKKLFADVDKSPVVAEPQGEKYARSFLNRATIKYPGTDEDATAFARTANNDDLVFLVREKSSGKWRVIGNEMFQCDVNVNLAIGGAPTDDRGITMEISCTDKLPAPFYDGEILTDEGDINPASS